MKKFILALALMLASPAAAQWQVPVNTIPVGRGPGVTGFSSITNSGSGNLCLINTAPPSFGSCPAPSSAPITNDTTTNASMNLVWVTSNTGSLPLKVSSTKLNFNPSSGTLSTVVLALNKVGTIALTAAITDTSSTGTVASFINSSTGGNSLSVNVGATGNLLGANTISFGDNADYRLGWNTSTGAVRMNALTNCTAGVMTSSTGVLSCAPIDRRTVQCLNAAGDAALVQAALNTGKAVEILGPCVQDASLTYTTPRQLVYGTGTSSSYFTISTILSTAANILSTGGDGPIFQDLAWKYVQPDTTSRAALTAYTPTFKGSGSFFFRAKFYRIRISNAMVAFDINNNAGGSIWQDVEVSAYTKAFDLDGPQDTIRFDNVHCWPFDMTVNQTTIFTNATTLCYNVGRVDDLKISNGLSIAGTSFNFHAGIDSNSAFAQISNFDSDTFNGIVMSAGSITMTGGTFTVAADANQAVVQSGGLITMNGVNIFKSSSGATPNISQSAGLLNIVGGQINGASGDTTQVSSTGGTLMIDGIFFQRDANLAYTRPTISVGAGVLATITNSRTTPIGVGSGTFITVGGDNFNNINGNTAQGWTCTFPAAVLGVYYNNCVPSQTGTGALVLNNSPTFITPVLGTPASGNGSNITNVNAATLGGATFASPGTIGNATPSTGVFTSLTVNSSVTGTNAPVNFLASGLTNGSRLSNLIGRSAGTNLSGYLAYTPNATPANSFMSIGFFGNDDILKVSGTGLVDSTGGWSTNGTAGLSVTKTVRAAGGAGDCTLVFTGGLLTGGSC